MDPYRLQQLIQFLSCRHRSLAYAGLAHLSNRQDVEHGLERNPEDDQAQGLGVPEGFERGQSRGEVGQAGVRQVDLESHKENPGWEKEQPEVGS